MANTSSKLKLLVGTISGHLLGNRPNDEDSRKRNLMFTISSIGILFLLLLGVIAIIQGGTLLAILDFSAASILLVLLSLLPKKGYLSRCINVGVLIMSILYLYLITSGGITGTAFLWSYTYPLFTCFLLGSKKGFLLSFSFFLFCLFVMILDLSTSMINVYTLNIVLRFIPSFAVVLLFSVLYERHRESSYHALIAANNNLEKIVQERTAELVKEVQNRKEKEEELLVSEARYRSLYDNSGDGISIISIEGKIISANKQVYARLGYTADAIKTKNPEEFFDKDSREPLKAMLKKAFETGSAELEATQLSRTGKKIPVEILAQRIVIDNKNHILSTCRDITERKKQEEENKILQEQLHRASTMEAIGLMAGGVAHDLNNILAGITGYPELIILKLPPDSKLIKPLQAVLDSGRRAAAVVTELLTMARGAVSAKKSYDCNNLIDNFLSTPEAIKILKDHPNVAIVTELSKDTGAIDCSAIHIEKCIMNLLINAVEVVAEKESARVQIMTERISLSTDLLNTLNLSPGDYVAIIVRDNGSGISQQDIEKIFEPFYSKKILGRSGTGLGLTVVWNVVHEHHGTVNVESSKLGTTFTLYLPASDQPLEKSASDTTELEMISSQSILVVDDDPLLRDIGKAMFESFGCSVKTVSSGEDAIVAIKMDTFDLILIDMLMEPGINGRQTYEKILQIKPGQKALIASGYSENKEVKQALALGAGGFIKKPYSVHELFRAMQRIEEEV